METAASRTYFRSRLLDRNRQKYFLVVPSDLELIANSKLSPKIVARSSPISDARPETPQEQPINRQSIANKPPINGQSTANEPPINRQLKKNPPACPETPQEQPINGQSTANQRPINGQSTANQPPINGQSTANEQPIKLRPRDFYRGI